MLECCSTTDLEETARSTNNTEAGPAAVADLVEARPLDEVIDLHFQGDVMKWTSKALKGGCRRPA